MNAGTSTRWRPVRFATLTQRVDPAVVPHRRWTWVEWNRPGEPRHLCLLTPLANRLGLLEFTLRLRGRRGAWVRPLRVSESKEKAAAKVEE